MKEMTRNMLLIGGLLVTGGSTIDGIKSGAFQNGLNELQQSAQIKDAMQKKYGIEENCIPDFNGGASCTESVTSAKTSEEQNSI